MSIINIKRLITKFFWCFPINDRKIFFSSYEGKQFSCNPKYIYKKIYELNNNKYMYVWEYNEIENIPIELRDINVRCVRHNSVGYFYHIITSKLIITNSGITANIALRKKQIQVNTWHGGGAYKKVGAVISEKVNGTSKKQLLIAAKQTDYFLSSSRYFSKIMQKSNLIDETKYLEIGMPRNDIFFNNKLMGEMSKLVRNIYKIPEASKIVLFAPTYRGDRHENSGKAELPCVKTVIKSLTDRFGGDWHFFVRDHYASNIIRVDNDDIVDVTDYPDMQDLLCAADVLITDYSSSIWDFCFTNKPCFLFVPDVDEYEKERGGFYTPIYTWPGIVTIDNEDLSNKIIGFNEQQYIKKIIDHKNNLGNVEKGDATNSLIEIIKEIKSGND